MMNEWGVPPVELFSLLYQYADKLAKRGEFVPHIAIAGGFAFEDQMFKGLAMGAPYFKAIEMARAPLTAAMVAKTIGKRIASGDMPVFVGRFGNSIEEVFVAASELKGKLGKDFEKVPPGALGVYTYLERLSQGLRQMMCGARKFSLEHFRREDIAALTPEASKISGIRHIMDLDKEEAEKILAS